LAPRDPALGKKQPKHALKTIVAGNHDSYIRQWAKDAAAWGKSCQAKRQLASPCTMYLRFAHEMNGTWFPWSPGVNGNTAQEFRGAWKRIHGIFQQEGATNVRWVWSPYINCSGCSSFSSVYPGNSYVDWVALDGYNWGTTLSGSSWQSMAQVFGPSYDAVTALAPTKPFMIPEVSSAEKGGSKAEWIRNAFNRDIPNRLPKTKAVVWFSADFTAAGETDWRVNSSAASLEAYKEVAALTSYQGQLP
jgi:beta-mannanase